MSTTQQAGSGTRTYRGRSLEELVPRIKEELGPDAVITRRREGLAGGIGGFFQRSFVEVEARPGGAAPGAAPGARERPRGPSFTPGAPRVDVYDDDVPATPPPYGAAEGDDLAADLDFGAEPAPGPGGEEEVVDPDAAAPRAGMEDAGEPPWAPAPGEGAADLEPAADDPEADERARLAAAGLDPATIEGLTSPAIRALMGQAAPFVDRAATAGHALDPAAAGDALDPSAGAPAAETASGIAGSAFARQLDLAHARERSRPPEGRQAAGDEPAASPEPPVTERADGDTDCADGDTERPADAPPARGRPPAADTVERSLRESGVSAGLAAEIVAETVSHLLPFGSPRGLKRLARVALARRIPVQGTLTGARAAAFVGPGGAGKTLCAARLAAAYAIGSDLSVACLTLDDEEGAARLARLLDEVDVEVRRFEDADGAAAWVGEVREDALLVVDTPAVSPSDEGAVRRLARGLRGLSPTETHLVVPATASAPAARDLVAGLRPLAPTCLALTHADETVHLGGVVEVAVETPLPVSYLSRGTAVGAGLEPADASAIAALVLP